MPVFLDLLDIELPDQYTAVNGTTYDVVDFNPTTESWADLLTSGEPLGEREFGIMHEGNRMYRKGDWKIVSSNFAGNDGGVGGAIEIRMCRIAARGHGFDPEDIHGFVQIIPMADAEIVRLQQEDGYAYMQ